MAAIVLESIDALFLRTQSPAEPPSSSSSSSSPSTEEPTEKEAPQTHARDLADLDKFIDDEMERQKTAIGMTWRKLAKCFKWEALKGHLEAKGVLPENELYRRAEALLKSNDLATGVEYNKEKKEITRVTHPEFLGIYEASV